MEPKVIGDGVKENPFKLFIPPRVNYGPVSAVRPQEVANQNFFMQVWELQESILYNQQWYILQFLFTNQ